MAFELLMSVSHGGGAVAAGIVTPSQSGLNDILSRVAVLGQIGYMLELLLGTATIVMGSIGLLRRLRPNERDPGAVPIDEHSDASSDLRQPRNEVPSDREPEITIRLEHGLDRILDRDRCIVTIHRSSGSAHDRRREVWYARGGK